MGRREYHSWFPVANSQIGDPEFQSLTPTQKLYYWFVVSEYNYFMAEKGEYYRSDLWIASALGSKERTIREARRECQRKGFIKTTPGHYNFKTGQGVATRYEYVKWSIPDELTGGFAKFKRYHLDMLLETVRAPGNPINVTDVVVYIYLDFLRDRFRDEDFYVTKRDLREWTKIKKSPESLKNLYDGFLFKGDSHLFEYNDHKQKIYIYGWSEALEPFDDDAAYRNSLRRNDNIAAHVDRAKRDREEQEIDRIRAKAEENDTVYFTEDLYTFFRKKYKEMYNKVPPLDISQRDKLIHQGEEFSPEQIASLINFYFKEEEVPNPTGATYRTLGRFLSCMDELEERKNQKMYAAN